MSVLVDTEKENCTSFDMQVVEIVDRYDEDCVPSNYSYNKLAFIQSSKTNKTCTKRLIVSSNPFSTDVFDKA